jgi:hypothetical protein
MDDRTVRATLERHWDASDASDFKFEYEIYHADAVLDYPQSGERIRGRHNIQESRFDLCVPKIRFGVDAASRRLAGDQMAIIDRAGHILCRPILGGLHHQYGRI